jgi:hypothetical protein
MKVILKRAKMTDALRVLSGFRIELLLATRGTEIIFLPFVLAGELGGLLIHGHFTDRIDCHF